MPEAKPKKVVILWSSPRPKGNSAALAEAVAAGAREAGAEVETVALHGMDIRPCHVCESCHRPDAAGCVLLDDMQGLFPKLVAADAIVCASPIFWFTFNAQLKLCIDRWYALMSPDGSTHAFKGKRLALALCYGSPDPMDSGCINAIRTFQDLSRFVGARLVGWVHASAHELDAVRADTDAMQAARDLGKRLVEA
jgi:multimeric flavodoxin WrbA